MKVNINEEGILTVKPETPLEAYALRKWGEESINQSDDGIWITDKLIVCGTVEVIEVFK